ncbi:type IV secretion protein Rhs [Bifidobacterium italicum]|uniref:Type IV secretion protein Rhs n=1 Tax=Bifidobacterium italicum TaxID=1960968 RepID=A0A2A2EL50_9BIFI|nr:FctA domain-containing protein [Bifidobacterium italicum]PAU69660.1 type IV secretion protein Rhs [Bifidobacterium italicum]
MNGQQVLEWGKRLFDSVSTYTKKTAAAVIGLVMIATMAIVMTPTRAEASNAERVADPTTFTQWEQGIGNQTDPRSTGRVWTDKSVSTDAVELKTYDGKTVRVAPKHTDKDAFLVGLSAMSSAQKITGVSNVTKPLDIVLVLDTSSSMTSGFGYREVYPPFTETQLKELFILKANGHHQRITCNAAGTSCRRDDTNRSITVKTGPNDTNPQHTQVYYRDTFKITALQTAVNHFIDQTITANGTVANPNRKNRIGLISYGTNVTVQSSLTDDLDGLKTKVDALTTAGLTRSDRALEQAQSMLSSGARADASQIVIFFTDGLPTGSEGDKFNPTIANDAITQAKAIKDGFASIYAVGIFDNADPAIDVSDVTADSSDALKANAFMQAVSSNYPDATAYTALGARAPDADYYLTASDSQSLNTVFETIWDEVSSKPTSPIQSSTTSGTTAGSSHGVVRFTDQLGDYMHVLDMNSIVFAGQQFEQVSKTTSGDTTTYVFEGTVEANEIYKAADLSRMTITVRSFDTTTPDAEGYTPARQGDLVTVDVPEELLPLRLYSAKVNADGTVETQINRTHPMRLFYEVGLKDGVRELVSKPDDDMTQYIAANKGADGKIRFLTNRYDGQPNEGYGNTTAVFTPATTNDFYYFTQDTPLYASQSLDAPAKEVDAAGTYYYQRVFYADMVDGEHTDEASGIVTSCSAKTCTQWVPVPGDAAVRAASKNPATDQYYATAGTPRTVLANQYTREKKENPTNTAKYASSPQWRDTQVNVRLGNNGLQLIEIPGALTVTEDVVWPQGVTPDPDKSFPFTLTLKNADGTDFSGTVRGEKSDGTIIEIGNGSTFSLKDGESISVYDIPAGVTATCMQTDAGGPGWSVDDGPTRAGTVTSGGMLTMPYVNRYTLEPVTLEEPSVSGVKVLEGRDWNTDNDRFTFTISAGDANPADAMPEQTSVTLSGGYHNHDQVPFTFGSIVYTVPGTYRYVIRESDNTDTGDAQPNMRYSAARYVLTVVVKDDGNGNLMIASRQLTHTFTDDGAHIDGEPVVEGGVAVFTNRFLGTNKATADIHGIKRYEDVTGTNPNNTVGKFKVRVTADPANPDGGPELPEGGAIINVGLDGSWRQVLQFTGSALGHDDEPKRFTYHVSEVVPEGVTVENPTKDGMTYDLNDYTVVVTVSRDAQANLVTSVEYPGGGTQVELSNRYEATPVDAQLDVRKKVTGGAAAEGKFTFEASLAGEAANVMVNDAPWAGTLTATTPEIAKDATGDVTFPKLTFTKPGTYTFTINEQLPETVLPDTLQPTAEGWTYDTHRHTVTVVVTDEQGTLQATLGSDESTKLFTNSYAVEPLDYGDVGALRISKTLTGRAMRAGEFPFGITPIGDAPLPEGAGRTSNPYTAPAGQALVWPVNGTLLGGLTFTKEDAGKTYCYEIAEIVPSAAMPGPDGGPVFQGVTYDTAVHKACIAVSDTGKGTLEATTTVDDAATTVAAFTNHYKIEPTTQSVTFMKALQGRDWKDGESFTFALAVDKDSSSVDETTLGAAMPQTHEVTVTKDNANGFGFGDFTFSKPGTYVYTVTEANAGKTIDGLQYAESAQLRFSVVDNGLGEYSVGWTVTGIDGTTFVNVYEPEPVQVATPAELTKELRAPSWDDDWRFRFTLQDVTEYADDDPQPTLPQWTVQQGDDEATGGDATDDGDPGEAPETPQSPLSCDVETRTCTVGVGKPESGLVTPIDFGTFTFTRAGAYVYEVREIDDSATQGGIYYDTHTATLTITVTDEGNGKLTATTRVDDGTFVNTAGVELPSTGGRREQGMITLALAIVFLFGAAGCAIRMNRVTMGG